jgi:hypothetical protein
MGGEGSGSAEERTRRCMEILEAVRNLKKGTHPRADLEGLLVEIGKRIRFVEEMREYGGEKGVVKREGGVWVVESGHTRVVVGEGWEIERVESSIEGMEAVLVCRELGKALGLSSSPSLPEEIAAYLGLFVEREVRCFVCLRIACPVECVVPLVRLVRDSLLVSYHIPCFISSGSL